MMVSLIGAGPGDSGLLTLKGAQRIQNADVVLYDRFVSEDILVMMPASAKKIDVGKTAGNHPVPQEEINSLLLENAKQGLNVVRLKGGDPFVFGRGGEELALLFENNIPFEVVPGVTSAIAGGAYAGIPVTHRDYTSSLHIITGHAKNNEPSHIDYEALVRTKGTLVFMMGLGSLGGICKGCIAAGMDKDMPAAIIENATRSAQRKFIGTVETLPNIALENNAESPVVIIIGNVCTLSDSLDWFSKKPLFGKRVAVARTKPGISKLSNSLRELGCQVSELPSAKIVPIPYLSLKETIKEINNYSWLIFTSSIGVSVFFDYLIEIGFDIRMLHHVKIACVGPETEKELAIRGIKADYYPDEYNGIALAKGLSERVKNGEQLLIARAKDGSEDLTRILTDADIKFNDIAIYETSYHVEEITDIQADFVAFTSSSAVDRFVQSGLNTDIKAVCIGERTAATAKSYGMKVFVSEQSTVDSMVKKIRELFEGEKKDKASAQQ